jgi:hypothetical protein
MWTKHIAKPTAPIMRTSIGPSIGYVSSKKSSSTSLRTNVSSTPPAVVLHHQLGQLGSVDQDNAGVDSFCIDLSIGAEAARGDEDAWVAAAVRTSAN